MRADIDKNGVMYIIPENETEAFTLACWIKDAAGAAYVGPVSSAAPELGRIVFWRFDKLIISTAWPRMLGDR